MTRSVSAGKPVPLAEFLGGREIPAEVRGVLVFHAPALGSAQADQFRTVVNESEARGPEVVALIQKRPNANPFPGMITLGRVQNNDVVLPYAGISRQHAYFMWPDEDPCPVVQDSGSSGGTSVKGERLAPRVDRVRVVDGSPLDFGTLRCTFLTPSAFRARLERGGPVTGA